MLLCKFNLCVVVLVALTTCVNGRVDVLPQSTLGPVHNAPSWISPPIPRSAEPSEINTDTETPQVTPSTNNPPNQNCEDCGCPGSNGSKTKSSLPKKCNYTRFPYKPAILKGLIDDQEVEATSKNASNSATNNNATASIPPSVSSQPAIDGKLVKASAEIIVPSSFLELGTKSMARSKSRHIMLGTDGPEDLSDLIRQSKVLFTPMEDWKKARQVTTFEDFDQFELFSAAKEHRAPAWEIKAAPIPNWPPPKVYKVINRTKEEWPAKKNVPKVPGVNDSLQVLATQLNASTSSSSSEQTAALPPKKVKHKVVKRRRTYITTALLNDPRIKKLLLVDPEQQAWGDDRVDLSGGAIASDDNGTVTVNITDDTPMMLLPQASPRFRALVSRTRSIKSLKSSPPAKIDPNVYADRVRIIIAGLNYSPTWPQRLDGRFSQAGPYYTPEPISRNTIAAQEVERMMQDSAKAVRELNTRESRDQQSPVLNDATVTGSIRAPLQENKQEQTIEAVMDAEGQLADFDVFADRSSPNP